VPSDSKTRFSSRVTDYARYRPTYPPETLDILRKWCALKPEHTIADIGSGTGILSKLFLENGNRVFGVEPNPEMRAAAEQSLASYDRFTSVSGSAEATTLPENSVDFVTVAQAFHWFDPEPTRREFQRILKIHGRAVIVWNERLPNETAFLRDYESLLRRFGTDYSKVNETYPRTEQMLAFFAGNEFTSHALPNFQEFDLESLSGRLRSSSFIPTQGHPKYAPMMKELHRIFSTHQKNNQLRMEYRTHIYTGKLESTLECGGSPPLSHR
jgi:ubiquinone/menaquinone biosynthesis C-methylase UbiE